MEIDGAQCNGLLNTRGLTQRCGCEWDATGQDSDSAVVHRTCAV